MTAIPHIQHQRIRHERTHVQQPLSVHQLWATQHDRVFRYIAYRVGLNDAADVTGEVYAEVMSSKHRYDPSLGEPEAWLFGICQRQIARHRRLELAWLRGQQVASSGETDPIDQATTSLSLRPALVRALAEIVPTERDTFLLFVLGDLTYEQISIALDVPVGTVRSRISRARMHLGALINNEAGASNER